MLKKIKYSRNSERIRIQTIKGIKTDDLVAFDFHHVLCISGLGSCRSSLSLVVVLTILREIHIIDH